MRTNEHTYAIIKRLHNQELYKVAIKRTWDTDWLFGIKTHEDIEEIPFIFTSNEVAKDFVSVLPDEIKKTTIKGYDCETSYFLSYVSYETYKLIIGNFEVYVKWNCVNRHRDDGLLIKRTFLKPNKISVVESFMLNVKSFKLKLNGTPQKYTNEIITTGEYKKLSELINYIKDKEDKKIENNNEQTFELIQNA